MGRRRPGGRGYLRGTSEELSATASRVTVTCTSYNVGEKEKQRVGKSQLRKTVFLVSLPKLGCWNGDARATKPLWLGSTAWIPQQGARTQRKWPSPRRIHSGTNKKRASGNEGIAECHLPARMMDGLVMTMCGSAAGNQARPSKQLGLGQGRWRAQRSEGLWGSLCLFFVLGVQLSLGLPGFSVAWPGPPACQQPPGRVSMNDNPGADRVAPGPRWHMYFVPQKRGNVGGFLESNLESRSLERAQRERGGLVEVRLRGGGLVSSRLKEGGTAKERHGAQRREREKREIRPWLANRTVACVGLATRPRCDAGTAAAADPSWSSNVAVGSIIAGPRTGQVPFLGQ